MAVQLNKGGDIPNIFPGAPGSLSKAKKEDVYHVIGALDYTQIFQNSAGTLHSEGAMRIDMQGTFVQGTARFHNIQVQVNGVQGKSTVAHANVSETTMTADSANQRGVVRKVISALNQSFDTGKSYSVTGTAP